MEEPLFAHETIDDVKKEEPDDYPQEVKEEINGDHGEIEQPFPLEDKPTLDPTGTVVNPADPSATLPSKEPSGELRSPHPSFETPVTSQSWHSFGWKCHVEGCGLWFPVVRLLNDHMVEHPGRLPFGCSYCTREFRTNQLLKQHNYSWHRKETAGQTVNPFRDARCPDCGKFFPHQADFEKHVQLFRGPHFFCESCDLFEIKFAEHQMSEYHLSAIKRQNVRTATQRLFPEEATRGVGGNLPVEKAVPYEMTCPLLNNAIGTENGENVKEKVGAGPVTLFPSTTMGEYLSHLPSCVVVTSPQAYPCTECGQTFSVLADFVKHVRSYKAPHFFCEICDLAGVYLQEHLKSECHLFAIHTEEIRKAIKRPHSEDIDGSGKHGKPAFTKVSALWKEVVGAQKAEDIMRQIDAEGAVKVNEVKFEGVKDVVDEGRKTLPSEEPPISGPLPFTFKCPKCEFGFHVFTALRSHMLDHHPGVSPLWCPVCPRRYLQLHSFWMHLKRHHGVDRPPNHPSGYKCDECGAFYRLRDDYATHCHLYRGFVHSYCHPCSETFLGTLTNHLTKRHRQSPYIIPFACQECGKQHSDMLGLKSHRESLKMVPHVFCDHCMLVLDPDDWEKHQVAKGHNGVKIRFFCCRSILLPEEWERHQMWHIDNMKNTLAVRIDPLAL